MITINISALIITIIVGVIMVVAVAVIATLWPMTITLGEDEKE